MDSTTSSPRATWPAPDTATTSTRPRRGAVGFRTLGWLLAFALAATMASERAYWYWGGISPLSAAELAVFYGVAAAVGLFALVTSRGTSWKSILAAGALFGLVVEGTITPVVYEDGPLPVLFFLFVCWHGAFAFAGFAVLVRRWALDGKAMVLGTAAAATGVYWGAWALISAVVDRVTALEAEAGGGSSEVLAPADFATYAGWVGLTLISAHVALDRVWPTAGWRPSRRAIVITAAIVMWFAAIFVILPVPWAPAKFGLLAWVLWRALRRHGSDDPTAPTVVETLAGKVRLRDLLPLAAMPIMAAVVYALLWPLRDASSMSTIFWVLTAKQVLIGAAATVWILWPGRSTSISAATDRRRP